MFRATLALIALSLVTVVALLESATAASPVHAPLDVEAQATATRRREAKQEVKAEIKSMDILERPNRPGHFYGNTVRRRAVRTGVIVD